MKSIKTASRVLLIFAIVFSFVRLTVQASIGDRQTPYSAFIKHSFPLQKYSWDPKRTVEIQLKNIFHGEAANQLVSSENMFNELPGSDEEWILLEFNMKYVSGPEEQLDATDIIFSESSFFTPSGVSLSPIATATLSDQFEGFSQFDVSLYPGSESTVIYGILVKKSVGGYPLVRIPTSYNSANGTNTYAWLTTNPSYKEPVNVTKISINKKALRLGVGTSEKLTSSIQPATATNKNLVWSTSNSSVAKVKSDGTISAIKPGTAKITVKTSNGKYATSNVTVVPVISAVSSDGKSVKNNAVLNKNVVVKVTNNKLTSKTVIKNGRNITWPASNSFTQEGKYTVTIKDGYGKVNKFTFTIDKKAPALPSVSKVTSKTTYVSGKAEKRSVVYIYKGSKLLSKGTASSSGTFKLKISKQRKGSSLQIYSKDVAGNKSKTRTIKVN
ncbi:Ig-like domain-containing protein [Neobacillus drentensis]|uniref:Ig-like domain-containing protein n=1 Tax=Neobacillus drentensis TaxID=220684 RepID=UPI002858A497|nr:Ig-like domain-containing protein [Neobacillus drentensis]MDR7239605.1 hypothetical protein [Neobacillus drentensis]